MHIYCCLWIFTALVNIVNSELCPSGNLILRRGLEPEEFQDATDAHNTWRTKLTRGEICGQPKAKYMEPLVYDELLSNKTHIISKQCAPIPIPIHDRRWNSVGQNIYMTCSPEYKPNTNWTEAVEAWAKEGDNFVFPNMIKIAGADVSHYRQLAWSTTDMLGCDFVMFFNSDETSNDAVCYLYTCVYGNDANDPKNINSAPYEIYTEGCK